MSKSIVIAITTMNWMGGEEGRGLLRTGGGIIENWVGGGEEGGDY